MSTILNLKDYDLVFTTSFETNHGPSGHLYELIEYYSICKRNGINVGIALLDGTKKDLLISVLYDKYDFTEDEISDIQQNTIENFQPKMLITHNLCVVDGAPKFFNCVIYADNVFLLRCYDGSFEYFSKHKSIKQTHLMQDFSMYLERFEDLNIRVVDYKKKLLWNRYKKPKLVKTNTAMFYMMSRCKGRPTEEVQSYIKKLNFDNYLIITDSPNRYKQLESEKVIVKKTPVKDLFELFDTYIYTPVDKLDCSPRFIVECAVFNKEVIYEMDYIDAGVEARRRDIKLGVETLLLKDDDFFVEYVKKFI